MLGVSLLFQLVLCGEEKLKNCRGITYKNNMEAR